MKVKTKIVRTLIMVTTLFILSAPVIAGNGHGPGDGSGTGDAPGDGTGNGPGTGDCLDMVIFNNNNILLTKGGNGGGSGGNGSGNSGGGYGPGDGTGQEMGLRMAPVMVGETVIALMPDQQSSFILYRTYLR